MTRDIPISKVRIILPKGKNTTQAEILKLEDKTDAELQDALENHFFESGVAANYAAMYSAPDSKTVDNAKVRTFLDTRRPRPNLPPNIFNGDADLPGLRADALSDVNERLEDPGAEFELLPDDQPSATCDRTPADITKEVLLVQAELSDFLLNYGTTSEDPRRRAIISSANAQVWVTDRLEATLEVIAEAAKTTNQGVFFHEPHHDLTPGMLLLDQLFRRMAKEVNNLVTTINLNTQSGTEPDLTALGAFVNGLTDPNSQDESKKFRTYIHAPGDHSCLSPSESAATFHVDPPRIEVFFSADGQIQIAALVVGAWAGGTHSSGHR